MQEAVVWMQREEGGLRDRGTGGKVPVLTVPLVVALDQTKETQH